MGTPSGAMFLEATDHRLKAIFVNPPACVRPHDYQGGLPNSGILTIADGKPLALVAGGFDWVDVRDMFE
ncbi:MAG: hypothetical protein MUQ10_09935 [Anaerolineae bacterium]|nr:hypothetical protein [Anaerolineae bacterium]